MSFLNRLQVALTNPFYIKQRRLVRNWIETTPGIQHLQLKNASFYITASKKQEKLAHFLDDIDQIIESGLMVKNLILERPFSRLTTNFILVKQQNFPNRFGISKSVIIFHQQEVYGLLLLQNECKRKV